MSSLGYATISQCAACGNQKKHNKKSVDNLKNKKTGLCAAIVFKTIVNSKPGPHFLLPYSYLTVSNNLLHNKIHGIRKCSIEIV